jgi:hypothetical protein
MNAIATAVVRALRRLEMAVLAYGDEWEALRRQGVSMETLFRVSYFIGEIVGMLQSMVLQAYLSEPNIERNWMALVLMILGTGFVLNFIVALAAIRTAVAQNRMVRPVGPFA